MLWPLAPWWPFWKSARSVSLHLYCEVPIDFAVVTSVAAGRVGDIIGRKGTLFIGALVFTVGGAIQTFTTGFWVMIIGRVVSGFGVGLLS